MFRLDCHPQGVFTNVVKSKSNQFYSSHAYRLYRLNVHVLLNHTAALFLINSINLHFNARNEHVTDQLTNYNGRFPPEKLTLPRVVKFPALRGNRKFITLFTRVLHLFIVSQMYSIYALPSQGPLCFQHQKTELRNIYACSERNWR
jgi:hypothetical protein